MISFTSFYSLLNEKLKLKVLGLASVVVALNLFSTLETIKKKNEFQKKLNPYIYEVVEVVGHDSIAIDFLNFNEWFLRCLIVNPNNREKLCSFERMPKNLEEHPLFISKVNLELAEKSQRHLNYTKGLNQFIQSHEPKWILSLNKVEFFKFYNRHKMNIPHLSVIHHFEAKGAVKKGEIKFSEVNYMPFKKIGPFVLYEKISNRS
jgi:hypothetical protein